MEPNLRSSIRFQSTMYGAQSLEITTFILREQHGTKTELVPSGATYGHIRIKQAAYF